MNGELAFMFYDQFFDSSESSDDEEVYEFFRGPIVRRPRVRNYLEEVVDRYSEEEFRENFRMYRDTFNHILGLIWNRIESNIYTPGRPSLGAKQQLLLTLWYFATPDCYRSICGRFNVGKATAHRTVRKVTNALFDLAPTIIKWPRRNNFNNVREGFLQMGFPDVIGVIDGTYIRIPMPKEHGVNYICRKNFPAIILQGVCDHRMMFTHCYAGEVGAIHDAQVLRRSEIWNFILDQNQQMFPENSHLLGDKAYPCIPQIMTPYRNNGHLTERQVNYNFQLSSARNTIERAFGLLKKRFRCLKDTLDLRCVEWMPKIIIACCVLHNICILQNDILELDPEEQDNNNDGAPNLDVVNDRHIQGNIKRNFICEHL